MKQSKKIVIKYVGGFSKVDHLINRLKTQSEFFHLGKTKDPAFRIEALNKLKSAIVKYEGEILIALYKDLGKSKFEAFLTEIGVLYQEINHAVANVKKWAKLKRERTPFTLLPARSWTVAEPYGRVLIIGPWNYPFQLIIAPLIAAIAAGNVAVLKPSEIAPYTSEIITKVISEAFDPSFVLVIEGGVDKTQKLIAQQFDYIFFTGGSEIGKIIMNAASKHLTPVTLELGGKSPVIVFNDASLEMAAKKIAWGKFLNAGQTCVAPDYVLAHADIKENLIERIGHYVRLFYGDNPEISPDYSRIINIRHFSRIKSLMSKTQIVFGGVTNEKQLYISPTIIKDVSLNHPIMKEEIFGPVLPVIEFLNINEVVSIIHGMSKPLALYLFTSSKENEQRILREISSGGVMINDTIIHLANHHLPFGGVGLSGIGAYHGKTGFYTFSHIKSVMRSSRFIDMPLRYPPYKNKLGFLKYMFR